MRGRPKKDSSKSKQITCRLTPDEYNTAIRKAKSAGKTLSDFVRCRIIKSE